MKNGKGYRYKKRLRQQRMRRKKKKRLRYLPMSRNKQLRQKRKSKEKNKQQLELAMREHDLEVKKRFIQDQRIIQKIKVDKKWGPSSYTWETYEFTSGKTDDEELERILKLMGWPMWRIKRAYSKTKPVDLTYHQWTSRLIISV